VRERRAVSVALKPRAPRLWVALERLGWLRALAPRFEVHPWISPALMPTESCAPADAFARLVGARRGVHGDAAEATVAALLGSVRQRDAAAG